MFHVHIYIIIVQSKISVPHYNTIYCVAMLKPIFQTSQNVDDELVRWSVTGQIQIIYETV